jgi:hypothetical protein
MQFLSSYIITSKGQVNEWIFEKIHMYHTQALNIPSFDKIL